MYHKMCKSRSQSYLHAWLMHRTCNQDAIKKLDETAASLKDTWQKFREEHWDSWAKKWSIWNALTMGKTLSVQDLVSLDWSYVRGMIVAVLPWCLTGNVYRVNPRSVHGGAWSHAIMRFMFAQPSFQLLVGVNVNSGQDRCGFWASGNSWLYKYVIYRDFTFWPRPLWLQSLR